MDDPAVAVPGQEFSDFHLANGDDFAAFGSVSGRNWTRFGEDWMSCWSACRDRHPGQPTRFPSSAKKFQLS